MGCPTRQIGATGGTIADPEIGVKRFFFANDFNGLRADPHVGSELRKRNDPRHKDWLLKRIAGQLDFLA